MKPEYKEKVLSNLDGIDNRVISIKKMLKGETPANQERAVNLTKEIERLVELTKNIVDIS